MAVQHVGVIGAGIIGLAVARQLGRVAPGIGITVLEKEHQVALHQTGRNSGVVHAGLYYPPGSLKATLCRRGVGLLREYCQQHGIAYQECGKLVVAVDDSERPALARLLERALANGVPDVRTCDPGGIRELEPHAAGVAGIHSPHTAITDYVAVAEGFAKDVIEAGGAVRLGFAVQAIRQRGSKVYVSAAAETLAFDHLVICAGLQSDLVAGWAGDDPQPAIVPFRGEYFTLVRQRTGLVNGLIYPVPDPAYPFLGVHFTRRVDGRVDVGPNAVLALSREGYRWGDISPSELRRTLAWPGFRTMARTHWKMGLAELAGSASKRLYLARARHYVPELSSADVVSAPAGVRAQALDRDGSLVDDFRIHRLGAVTAVRNAPSPAATSSLAIAEHIVDQLTGELTG